MSLAMVIPGISISSMAIVLGIYEKIIHLVSHPLLFLKKPKESLQWISPLVMGGLLGMLIFLRVIDIFLKFNAAMIYLFFNSMILGSLPSLY